MVTIDPADEAPEELTGKEFVEYMKNKKAVPTASVAEEEEIEPIAKPAIKGKRAGEMQAAAKGGKPAGEVEEFKSHKGYYVPAHTFAGKHPTLAKAVDIGKKAIGKAGEFVDEEILHHGEDEKKEPTEEEKKEEEKVKEKKKKTQKKLTGIEKKLKKGLLEDEDEEDDDEKIIKTKKSQILSRNYESAYGGDGGLSGTRGYKSAYSGAGLGSGAYQPAYKTTVQAPTITQPASGRIKEPEVEEEMPQPQPRAVKPQPDRFNIQNWQSMGFPNTLPQSARGSLFRPAPPRPQPTVVPMVHQPYQPRPTPQPMLVRTPVRAPLSGPMPKIGLNLNTMPQLMKPRATITPPRAQAPVRTTNGISIPTPTFFGVNLNEKKKPEPKPITNMGAGYKNVPLTVMDGLYPKSKYDPKKDPITKKSIIPKIQATITPNNFTMFGMKMKNKKGI